MQFRVGTLCQEELKAESVRENLDRLNHILKLENTLYIGKTK